VRSRINARKLPPSPYEYRNILMKFLDILPAYAGKFCPFCKVLRTYPLQCIRKIAPGGLAWELIDSDEPG
jgi:hypothetical protein